MKRFLSAVALCMALLVIGLFSFMPASEAQENTILLLLEMPAPPPPNPTYRPAFSERSEDFFDKKTPPPDNASTEDLLDYWKHQNQYDAKYQYVPEPSPKTLERLLGEVEKKPELLSQVIYSFPESTETAEFVKRLYDAEMSDQKFDAEWRTAVKKWLTYHTSYFSGELYQIAKEAADTDEYVTNQDEVLALARVDWEKAKPILDRLLADSNQPVSQTLARWAYYKHAIATGDAMDIEKYRRELQDTVENKEATPGNRDLAMDALVESGDFPGRDDWYYSLLEDETLYELRVDGQVYTGLTTIINHSPDDKYVAKMVELAASSSPAVRSAAVRNLSTLLDDNIARKNPSIVRALLPWLENPKWAKEVSGERTKVVGALRLLVMPESVPGLIAMLNEKEVQQISLTDSNANSTTTRPVTGNYNTARRTQTVDVYPYRSQAIAALATQKSPQAASALRQVLPFVESWERSTTVRAILLSNGFTLAEQIEALETAAKNLDEQMSLMRSNVNTVTNASTSNYSVPESYSMEAPAVLMANRITSNSYPTQPFNAGDLTAELGNQLVALEEPSEELVKAVIARIEFHERKNPPIAAALRRIVQDWKGAAINALFLRDLRDGKSNLQAVLKLLTLRKELREKQPDDVVGIRAGSQTALGISACLLEQPAEYDAILDGESVDAKTAMLACARLIRAALPVAKIAALLKSPNKLLALAAERYLETEDSPEARGIVLEKYPNEARILGARTAFITENDALKFNPLIAPLFASVDQLYEKFPSYYFYAITDDTELEKKLQTEVKADATLFGVYSYDNNFVRIYADRAVYSWQDDPARYRERVLSADEFEALKSFLAVQRVDELTPFLSPCEDCESKELLMLGKAGGRRVFVKADPLPPFFAELESIFREFRSAPAQIHYYFEKSVPGAEVLFAADDQKAAAVWKEGADFRLLIDDLAVRRQNEKISEASEDELSVENDESETPATTDEKTEAERRRREYQQRARQKAYGSFVWYKFDKTRLLDAVGQPALMEFIPAQDGFAVPPGEQQWKARAAGVEVRADSDGLFRIKGGQMTKIGSGYYYRPLVTPNGRWAIATKFERGEQNSEDGIMRINLLTGKESKINTVSDEGLPLPVAFIAPLNKVLLFSNYGYGEEVSERSGDLFLLDPETGAVQPFKGEVKPLLQQTFRPLQALAANAEQFWAAIPDSEKNETRFGIYNARTLSFTPLLAIPQILFDSMSMWIDEGEGKIYLVYEGQLLALPLPKNR